MLNFDELYLLGIKFFHLFGISEGKNQRQCKNFSEKIISLLVRTFAGEKSTV